MGTEANAEMKICFVNNLLNNDDSPAKMMLKRLVMNPNLYDSIYQLSLYTKLVGNEDPISIDDTMRVYTVSFSIDDRSFWFSRYGITLLRHTDITKENGGGMTLDEASEIAGSTNQNKILIEFCKTENCLIEFHESCMEAVERTIAVGDKILDFEKSKCDDEGRPLDTTFGKKPLEEFIIEEFLPKWKIKRLLEKGL